MKTLFLITGATGHLGQALVQEYLKEKAAIRALVLPHESHNLKQIEIIQGNILDKNSLLPFFKPQKNTRIVLIHCAGIVSISDKHPELMQKVNIQGTQNLLDLSIEHEIDQFIYVSSVHAIKEKPLGEIITEPLKFYPEEVVGAYAKTKAEASKRVLNARKKGLNTSLVFPSGMVGPYDLGNNHLTRLIINYANNKLPCGIKGAYDFVDVRDVAKAIVTLSKKHHQNEMFILSNKQVQIKDLLNMLKKITEKKETKICLPVSFVKLLVPFMELFAKSNHEKPLFTAYSLYTLQSNSLFSHEYASKTLDYKPRSLYVTLQDTLNYLKKHHLIK